MSSHHPASYPDLEPNYHPPRHSRVRPAPRWRAWQQWPLWARGLVGILIGAVAFTVLNLALRLDGPDPGTTPAGAPIVATSRAPQGGSAQSSVQNPVQLTPTATPSADLPEKQISGDIPPDMPYIVGVNISAGRYATAGALDAGTPGRWSTVRLRSSTGAYEPGAGGSTAGAAVVQLRVGDIFNTQGYRPWTKIP